MVRKLTIPIILLAGSLYPAERGTWTFEKISKFDRPGEPVAIGMPFPEGLLRDPRQFRLLDGGRILPVQTTVTGNWPDGSVRWLFIRTLVDLPGSRDKQISWILQEPPAASKTGLTVRKRPDGSVEVNTGSLSATVPARGFFPLADVTLNGHPVGAAGWMKGFLIQGAAASWSTADSGPVKVENVEEGPLAAVIRISGRHGGEGSPFDFSATLTFWSGKPDVRLDYTVLAARGSADVPVRLWEWRGAPGSGGLARLSHGQSTSEATEARGPLSYSFGPQQFRFSAVEHSIQSYWGDFWCDWTGDSAGITVTLRQAQQNFPKAMEAKPDGLSISLYPAEKDALQFAAGAAKTHSLQFHFHPADEPREKISARSLQFQIPDLPRFDPEWWARARVWDDRVFEGPRSRSVDAALFNILDNRPVGLGIWNFGDEIDWSYTAQGRGRDDQVWLNNEYDLAHQCYLLWARSGERRFLDYGHVNALHWRDVDIAHVSPNPLRLGGHISHSARHVTGGVGPSHQWVEGLFDDYHLLGDPSARDAALGIGENILRALPRYEKAGSSSTRDTGWALRTMLALYRETGDSKYLAPCRRIVQLFKDWHREYPGLLAPYTDHSMVRVIFMNSLTLTSLARYYLHFPDQELKRLILEETDEMIRNGRNSNGLFYYKELPSLKNQGGTPLVLQALGYAYLLSGERRYIEAGLPELDYQLSNGRLRFAVPTGSAEKYTTASGGYTRPMVYPQGGKFVGVGVMPLIEYLHLANNPELIRQLDHELRLP